jgi:hypothetical protein
MTGRVDFYLPFKKWGVELLRNGDKYEEHCGRFSQEGAYGGTLAISSWTVTIGKYLCVFTCLFLIS